MADILTRHAFTYPQMGTVFKAVLYAPDADLAHQHWREATHHLDYLNQMLSDYQPDSRINQLCATAGSGQALEVEGVVWDILEKTLHIARLTRGAYDPTVGQLTKLWRRAFLTRALPDERMLRAARETAGYEEIRMFKSNRTVRIRRRGLQLDFGGSGKGYAADQLLALLRTRGITSALIDAGGDLALGDPPPGSAGWEVAVDDGTGLHPVDHLRLSGYGVATSGDFYKYLELGGKRYSHILDPRTGYGVTDQRVVTVIAPDATWADALATVLSVWPPEEGLSLLDRLTAETGQVFTARIAAMAHLPVTVVTDARWATFVAAHAA
ncbi:MAG: FAD:protein FMN transferase [Bacteroidia bacterium]|nr:FAD:protein FMN transferase [Bacteroidia bacterium]